MPTPTPEEVFLMGRDPLDDVTVQAPILIFYGPALGDSTLGIYINLKLYSKLYYGKGPKDEINEMSLSTADLMRFLGLGNQKVIKEIKKLEELGFLTKIRSQVNSKLYSTNRYTLTVPNFRPSDDLIKKYWPKGWTPPEMPYLISPAKSDSYVKFTQPPYVDFTQPPAEGSCVKITQPNQLVMRKPHRSKEVKDIKKLLLQTKDHKYGPEKAVLIERFRKVSKPGTKLFDNSDLETFIEVAASRADTVEGIFSILSEKLKVVELNKDPKNPRGLWYTAIINDYQPPLLKSDRQPPKPEVIKKRPGSSLEEDPFAAFRSQNEAEILQTFRDLSAHGAPIHFVVGVLMDKCYSNNPLWPGLRSKLLKGGGEKKD